MVNLLIYLWFYWLINADGCRSNLSTKQLLLLSSKAICNICHWMLIETANSVILANSMNGNNWAICMLLEMVWLNELGCHCMRCLHHQRWDIFTTHATLYPPSYVRNVLQFEFNYLPDSFLIELVITNYINSQGTTISIAKPTDINKSVLHMRIFLSLL